MVAGNAPYDLVDRIASMEDRGLIPGTLGSPSNSEAANRARLSATEKARGRGWTGEVDARRHVLLLEEMLRTQAGVHVRLPSHHAAPFRAQGFETYASEVPLTADSTEVVVDALDDNQALVAAAFTQGVEFAGPGQVIVPQGYRAVITDVCVSIQGRFGTVAADLTPGWQTGCTWSLHKNKSAILSRRRPTFTSQHIIPTGTVFEPPSDTNLLSAPVNLGQGDSAFLTIEIPATGGVAGRCPVSGWVGRGFAVVRGYVYPTRMDEPSIRGTVVD